MTDAADTDWDAATYDDEQAYVFEHGADLVDLLAPEPGERVLDLGCGTGHLTAEIADRGATVAGLDAAPVMLERAREEHPGLTFVRADAAAVDPQALLDAAFDGVDGIEAVFSNAALHWIDDQAAVAERVRELLAPGGRFVAELGGRGNVATILEAALAERHERGEPVEHPWYFPTIGEHAGLLEDCGFAVRRASLFDRPTELPGEDGLREWLAAFGDALLAPFDGAEREAVIEAIEERVRPDRYDPAAEVWTADYRRLRFVASVPSGEE